MPAFFSTTMMKILATAMMMVANVSCLDAQNITNSRQYLLEGLDFKIPGNANLLCDTQYRTTLATITSLEDQIQAEILFNSVSSISILQIAAIGLDDITEERFLNKTGWQFRSGAIQSVEFWASGHPKDLNDDCVYLDRTKKTDRVPWTSTICNARTPYMCDDAPNPRFQAVYDRALNFSAAEKFCRDNYDTGLATVRNQAEQDYLLRVIAGFDVWIGLNAIENQLSWTSGIQVTFVQNGSDFSNANISDTCTEALGLVTSRTFPTKPAGFWRNVNCSSTKKFVCDRNFRAFIGGVRGEGPQFTNAPTTPIDNGADAKDEDEIDQGPNLLVILLGGGTALAAVAGFVGLSLVWRQEKRRLRYAELREKASGGIISPDKSNNNQTPPTPGQGQQEDQKLHALTVSTMEGLSQAASPV